MKSTAMTIVIILGTIITTSTCLAENDINILLRDRKAQLTYQTIEDNKLLVSVLDSNQDPIRGLNVEDFIVGQGIRKARILSAEPLETTEEIALNIVLVVDNSFSMKERRTIQPLLAAMEEFFKTTRPIDNIHLVVFDDQPKTQIKNYKLHTHTFKSSNIKDLRKFLTESLDQGLTGKTYLWEAMVTGMDIIRRMPEKDNKFLVVFSDGEDLNSSVSTSVIESEAKGIKNFEAFCVDYMPGPKLNRFLTHFASTHNGRIWKATSASELLPIFKAFTTTLRYRYVVAFQILDPLVVDQSSINLDMLTLIDGTPMPNYVFFETAKSEIPSNYVLFKDRSQVAEFDSKTLTTTLDKYLNILNLMGLKLTQNSDTRINIMGCNSNTGLETQNLDLSRKRADAVIAYLHAIWGIEQSRMLAEARNLPVNAASTDHVGARPENQRVEIVIESMKVQTDTTNDFIVETQGLDQLSVETNIFAEPGISDWQLTILGDDQPVKILSGKDHIDPRFTVSLPELGFEKLAACNSLSFQAQITNLNGSRKETPAVDLPIIVTKKKWIDELVQPPSGALVLEPQTITIEELTTIDSSPFLNYIYFNTGQSEIPDRYVLFGNQADTKTFDANDLKGTMEKHHHILNIVGLRLSKHSEARIRIVGCNSNTEAERGRTDLSQSRAEAVRAYLRYIWGIETSRMDVESRNLPAVASTNSLSEGREENQRVEIYSDSPALLDIVKSTYVQEISNSKQLRILPQIQSGYDIASWRITLNGDGNPIESLEGSGDLEPAYLIDLEDIGLQKIGACKKVTADIEVKDRKGQICTATTEANIQFIKREERLAQKEGYKVLEKYALILFDFNRSDIKEHNLAIINRIITRINEIPTATMKIVGHTDTIGKEEYNLALSNKRAQAAYDYILAGGVPANENITFEGIGPNDPLFDNSQPEGRALNRTVTVHLEYEQKQ